MFCTECGNNLKESEKFCTNCGKSQDGVNKHKTAEKVASNVDVHTPVPVSTSVSSTVVKQERWWDRLFKVVYILSYIILPLILIVVWEENSCGYYRSYCSGDEAFWATLFTFIGYVVFARLVKVTFLYIVKGQSVNWKKEFKSFF